MTAPSLALLSLALLQAPQGYAAETIALVPFDGTYLAVHSDGHVRRFEASGEVSGELVLDGALGLEWIRSLGGGLVAGTDEDELLHWPTLSADVVRIGAPGCGDLWCPRLRTRTIGDERLWVGAPEAGLLFVLAEGVLTLAAQLPGRSRLADVDLERGRMLCSGTADGVALIDLDGQVREVVRQPHGFSGVGAALFGRDESELFLETAHGGSGAWVAHVVRLERVAGSWTPRAIRPIEFHGFPTSLGDVVLLGDELLVGLGFTSAVCSFRAGDLVPNWSHENNGGTWSGTQLRVLGERGEVFVAGMGQTYVLDLCDGRMGKEFEFRRYQLLENDGAAGQLVMGSNDAFHVISIADGWSEVFMVRR